MALPSTMPAVGSTEPGGVTSGRSTSSSFASLLERARTLDEREGARLTSSMVSNQPLTPLPQSVLERYSSGAQECRCGLLPQIGRAWASVDTELFLWRPGEESVEAKYYTDEQVIVAADAACPPPSFYLPDGCTHLLVVCTPVDATLVGLCFGVRGAVAPSTPLHGQPKQIPGFTCSTDTIMPQCIACGPHGRIFFGGDDGCVHELRYEEPWAKQNLKRGFPWYRNTRMYRKAGSVSKRQLLPSVMSEYLFKRNPVRQVATDTALMLVYTLMDNGSIYMHSLGSDGKQALHRLAEAPAPKGNNKRVPISIAPLDTKLPGDGWLVAALANGQRLFYHVSNRSPSGSTGGSTSFGSSEFEFKGPPYELFAPSKLLRRDSSGAARSFNIDSFLAVDGCSIMHDAPEGYNDSSLIVCTRDYGANNCSVFAERVEAIEVEGKPAGGIVEENAEERAQKLHDANLRSSQSAFELDAQYVTPPRWFVTMTTGGIMRFRVKRPIDVVAEALQSTSEDLQNAYNHYGETETCCMFAALASGLVKPSPGSNVAAHARRALENPNLGGDELLQHPQQQQQVSDIIQHMGAPNLPARTPRADGLQRLARRALSPVLGQKLVKSDSKTWSLSHRRRVSGIAIPEEHLRCAFEMTQQVHAFVTELAKQEDSGNASEGSGGVVKLSEKLGRDLQMLSLLTILHHEDIQGAGTSRGGAPTTQNEGEADEMLRQAQYDESFMDSQGRSKTIAHVLIQAAVENREQKSQAPEQLYSELERHCSLFYGADDKQYHQAKSHLGKALQHSTSASGVNEAEMESALNGFAQSKCTVQNLDEVLARLLRAKRFNEAGKLLTLLAGQRSINAVQKVTQASTALLKLLAFRARNQRGPELCDANGATREYEQTYDAVTGAIKGEPLSEADAIAAKPAILKALAQVENDEIDKAVALALVDDEADDLLKYSGRNRLPLVERYMCELGDINALRAGSAVSDEAAARLKFAGKCRHEMCRYAEAADLWEALADRPPPDNASSVCLTDRRYCIEKAEMAAREHRDGERLSRLQAKHSAAELQIELRKKLSERQENFHELDERILSVDELLYRFAYEKLEDWEMCLKALDILKPNEQIRPSPKDYWNGILFQALKDGGANNALHRVIQVAKGLRERSWVVPPDHIAVQLALIACRHGPLVEALEETSFGRDGEHKYIAAQSESSAVDQPSTSQRGFNAKSLATGMRDALGGSRRGAFRAADAFADGLLTPEANVTAVRQMLLQAGQECVVQCKNEAGIGNVAAKLHMLANETPGMAETQKALAPVASPTRAYR